MNRLRSLALLALVVPGAALAQAAPRYNDVMTPVVLGDLAGVREVLALGKWPDKPDREGRTPLLVALELHHAEIGRALIEAGADLESALAAARRVGDEEMIALLQGHAAVGTGSSPKK